MIESIQFQSGFPIKLQFGKRPVLFGPRLNIVLGYNGAGKSTLLRALAADAELVPPLEIEQPLVVRDCEPVIYSEARSTEPLFDDHFLKKFSSLRSDGEMRIGLLNELRHHLRQHFPSYAASLDSRATLLLDEPELHLSPPAQFYLWRTVLPMLSKQFQLIVASHSLFAILLKKECVFSRDDRLLILSKGYEQESVTALARAVDQYNTIESRE